MLTRYRYIIFSVAIAIAGLALCVRVVWPAYRDPQSRMYSSGLGYGNLMRKMDRPFEVSAAPARKESLPISFLGEGVISGNPLRVPLIPMAKITKLHVEEGDHVKKGQLLLEMDNAEAEYNLRSAKLQVTTAESELERIKIGSAYVLAQERPGHDKIELEASITELNLLQEKVDSYKKLLSKGVIGRIQVLDAEMEVAAAQKKVDSAKFYSGISNKGAAESRQIAENALDDAYQNLALRERELENFYIVAPADGIVSQVLVREGEFNQDFGKPAFLLTTGKWFDGFFDQSAHSGIEVGQKAEIYLEAFPGKPIMAEVEKIVSEVTFASGGPEITRPLRPRGTGAPEWSASFRVRFRFLSDHEKFAMGMTGSVRVETLRDSLVVPRNAVLSISAGRGVVLKPTSEENGESFQPIPVSVGHVTDESIQICEGLQPGEEVLISGHRILRSGDRIKIK